jgi:hypothetical protein
MLTFVYRRNSIQNVKKINKYWLAEFNCSLSFVTLDDTFDDDDARSMFNSFLNSFYDFFIVVFLHVRSKYCHEGLFVGQHQLLKPYVAL